MFVNPGFGTLVSLLGSVGTCLWLTCLHDPSWLSLAEQTALMERSALEWRAEAERTVLNAVPDGFRPCGFVPLGADRREALNCIEFAERHGLPYWVASQAQGIDSQVWLVVLRATDGNSQLLLDSYDGQARRPQQPRFTVTKLACESIETAEPVQIRDSDGLQWRQPAFACRR